MGTLLDFETAAVASLRRRVAEVEEANQDLIAFARGHSGAVAAIHRAVLAAIEADGSERLIHVVTQEWPDLLGLDAVALALSMDGVGLRADASGLQEVDVRIVDRAIRAVDRVTLRDVGQGHPMFGPASSLIRAEALIRLDASAPLATGLLALGQRRAQGFETRHGAELLSFLGDVLARSLSRWLIH